MKKETKKKLWRKKQKIIIFMTCSCSHVLNPIAKICCACNSPQLTTIIYLDLQNELNWNMASTSTTIFDIVRRHEDLTLRWMKLHLCFISKWNVFYLFDISKTSVENIISLTHLSNWKCVLFLLKKKSSLNIFCHKKIFHLDIDKLVCICNWIKMHWKKIWNSSCANGIWLHILL